MDAHRGSGTTASLLTFEIEGRRLAVYAESIVEVVAAVAVAPVPKGPPILEGVIDYRGEVIPVLDTRVRLGLRPRPIAVDEHMIVVRFDSFLAALRVDRALHLLTVDSSTITDAEREVPQAEMMAGVVRLPDGLVVIQDLAAFLDMETERAVKLAVGSKQAPGRFR